MPRLSHISRVLLGCCLVAAVSLPAIPLFAQSGVPAQTVVTIMPGKSSEQSPTITESQVQATVAGKRAQISSWVPLRGEQAGLQIVVLIDGRREAE